MADLHEPKTFAAKLQGRTSSHKHTAGTLPDSWERLSALQELHLSGNGLTGTMPTSWQSSMLYFTVLRLKFNKIGCVPPLISYCLPAQPPFPMATWCLPTNMAGCASRLSLHWRSSWTHMCTSM